ncbi:unnamed protein product [Zymoseptoria tritici ST99CH_1E4]|uniref:Uncharacterized protein n=1 Tax=Zymoseptoria tritici ST99CH_1E4 TaxID=1276532 RepID=A0A2H1HBU9_ZYMTR|nr:unnamed protein product [Zymoseptoria tritici ST99CH_1E4]
MGEEASRLRTQGLADTLPEGRPDSNLEATQVHRDATTGEPEDEEDHSNLDGKSQDSEQRFRDEMEAEFAEYTVNAHSYQPCETQQALGTSRSHFMQGYGEFGISHTPPPVRPLRFTTNQYLRQIDIAIPTLSFSMADYVSDFEAAGFTPAIIVLPETKFRE